MTLCNHASVEYEICVTSVIQLRHKYFTNWKTYILRSNVFPYTSDSLHCLFFGGVFLGMPNVGFGAQSNCDCSRHPGVYRPADGCYIQVLTELMCFFRIYTVDYLKILYRSHRGKGPLNPKHIPTNTVINSLLRKNSLLSNML